MRTRSNFCPRCVWSLVRRALRWLRSDPMRDAMARKMREARSLRDAADSEWEKDFQRFRLGALKIQSCFCIPPNKPDSATKERSD